MCCRRASSSTCRRCAICATARTRIRRRRGTPNGGDRLRRRADPAGQGAVVHQPARSRFRRAHRPRVQRAGRAVIKHTNPCGAATGTSRRRRLRPRARGRSARRLRRHRRVEPPDRRGDGAGDHVHVHRGGHRARRATRLRGRSWRGRPTCAWSTVDFAALAAAAAPELRSILGAVLVQERDVVAEGHHAWPGTDPGELRVVTKRQPTEDEWQRAAIRVAHLRAREVERGDLHQRPIGRWRSARAR